MPDIVEFTELGDYLDLPVHLLSGMMTRLTFGVATGFAPEIFDGRGLWRATRPF
jgi:ABC-2 type transport system ATP-binding protein/lipopolysaccharide transport system ATP-binding protein